MILKTKRIKAAGLAAAMLILFVLLTNFPQFAPFSFSIDVSAEPIAAVINFDTETINLSGGTGIGIVRYMYSPNVNPNLNARNYSTADARRMSAEKWFPVYGDTIDISRFIPRSGEVVFAFRDADELPNSDGVFLSREVSGVIPERPRVSNADFRNNARYVTAPSERIIITGELLEGYEYKVGISQWIAGEGPFIDVNSRWNASGGTVSVRRAATPSDFASAEFKIKLPRAPAAPKLRVTNTRIIGIKMRDHRWATSENGTYREFTYSAIDLNNFEVKMGAGADSFLIVRENDEDFIAIFIRIPATERRPSSGVQRLLVPLSAISGETAALEAGGGNQSNNRS
jgi:hypothetical protein